MNDMLREPLIRPASMNDAADLARFINAAGEGMPLDYWTELAAPGQDPWAVGRARMQADTGDNSWRNWTIAEREAAVAGGICTYLIAPDAPPPGDDLSPRFRPLVALEHRARGTLHVHVLATYPQHRRAGIGRALLAQAVRQANGRRCSIIVDSRNRPAETLYRACGFDEVARRAIRDGQGAAQGGDWLLLMR